MVSVNAAITINQKEYREIDVLVQDNAGAVVSLSGIYTIKWAMAKTQTGTPILTKSYPASGIRIDTPTNGIFTIVISGVDTADLAPGLYYQQADYNLGGKTVNVVTGTVRIRPTII